MTFKVIALFVLACIAAVLLAELCSCTRVYVEPQPCGSASGGAGPQVTTASADEDGGAP